MRMIFFLAAQLPATASDGLSSSVFLFYLSGYLTSRSPTPRQADIYGIFCSAEIFTSSLHHGRELFVHLLFHLFFAEMTFCQADFPVILAAPLLFVFFLLREEFAFLFQTFSRSDPPGKAPLTRGRYVLKKRKKVLSKVEKPGSGRGI